MKVWKLGCYKWGAVQCIELGVSSCNEVWGSLLAVKCSLLQMLGEFLDLQINFQWFNNFLKENKYYFTRLDWGKMPYKSIENLHRNYIIKCQLITTFLYDNSSTYYEIIYVIIRFSVVLEQECKYICVMVINSWTMILEVFSNLNNSMVFQCVLWFKIRTEV